MDFILLIDCAFPWLKKPSDEHNSVLSDRVLLHKKLIQGNKISYEKNDKSNDSDTKLSIILLKNEFQEMKNEQHELQVKVQEVLECLGAIHTDIKERLMKT